MIYNPVIQRHEKVIVVGGGESLSGFDFCKLNAFKGAIIAVNESSRHIPRSDYWITIDMGYDLPAIINFNRYVYNFIGVPENKWYKNKRRNVHILKRVPYFSDCKHEITGGNSGLAALNLAYHFEASQILLLGIDCGGAGHWYDKNIKFDNGTIAAEMEIAGIKKLFARSLPLLKEKSRFVANGSPVSGLQCFPKMSIEKGLKWIGVE